MEQRRETKDTLGVTMVLSVETTKEKMNVTAVIATNKRLQFSGP